MKNLGKESAIKISIQNLKFSKKVNFLPEICVPIPSKFSEII